MIAIEASTVRVSTLVDGTMRVVLDIEPRLALAAFTLLGSPGTAVAVAALKPKAAPLKEPPKRQLMSQWLAMRCGEREFHLWADKTFSHVDMSDVSSDTPHYQVIAELVRRALQVKSRALIDTDHEARERFDRLILKPWEQHCRATT